MKHVMGIFTISALALNFNAMADVVVDIPANTTDLVMCDYSTLGVYSGSVVLEAIYEKVDCPDGQIYYDGRGCIAHCPENHYCDESGMHECPKYAPNSPADSTSVGDCGYKVHIGDTQMYFHQNADTPKPRLAIKIKDKTFYATMTKDTVKMSKDSDFVLHISLDGNTYSVHDNSVSE